MRLAAEHGDFWVTTGLTTAGSLGPDEGAAVVAAQVRRLEDVCHQVGRDASTLRKLVLTGFALDPGLSSGRAFHETVRRYEEVGVTDFVVHWPRSKEPFAGEMALFEEIFSS
jgi:alkanesulfonate monooxygenase SsuD/methylene tetrahydromethanopterin reductase-like flavin-dependent oxidoreductase (luciferase family)